MLQRLSATKSDYSRSKLDKSFQKSRQYLNTSRKYRATSPDVVQRHTQHFQQQRAQRGRAASTSSPASRPTTVHPTRASLQLHKIPDNLST